MAATEVDNLTVYPTEPIFRVSVREVNNSGIGSLHSVSVSCEVVNRQLLVLLFPSSVLGI
jgi:hypothetical protein